MNLTSNVQHLVVPIRIPKQTGKQFYYLSMNQYSKWHFQVYHYIKKTFAVLTLEQARQLKPINKCCVTYTVYHSHNRDFDLDNFGSIISKFTHDVLTEAGVLVDDSFKYVPKIVYKFGGIDKLNPRCEVEIEEILDEEEVKPKTKTKAKEV